MPLLKFISIKLCLALTSGILVGFYFSFDFTFLLIFFSISLLALGVSYKKQKRDMFPYFGVISLFTTAVFGVVLTTIALEKSLPSHYSKLTLQGDGTWHLKVKEVLKPSAYSERYFAEVISNNGNHTVGTVALNIAKDNVSTLFSVDDEVVLSAQMEAVKKPLNPYQFDYQDYLRKKGIYHQIRVGKNDYLRIKNPSRTIFGLAYELREGLVTKLKQYDFGEEELSIIQALLLGKRDDISDETYNNYKNAGAVHILAVSGLHVGILLLIFQFLLKPLERLPKGRTLKLFIIIAFLWSFAFIAGLSPSIIRAVTMFSFLAYAMNLNRPTNTFNIIALSIFFILLINPLLLFQVGFQMSYAAVIAIVWIYPKLQRFWYPNTWLVRNVWQLFSVSIAAQLGVLPISLFYFHQFPALFFVANLVVIPFLGIILGGGLLVLLLASIKLLPSFLVTAYNYLIQLMNAVVAWVARQESFLFQDISFDTVQLILAYTITIGLIFTLQKPMFKNWALFLVGIITFQGWSLYVLRQTINSQELILAHQTANTILLHQNGSELILRTSDKEKSGSILQNYKVGKRIELVSVENLQNSYSLEGKSFLIVDDAITLTHSPIDFLILTKSPKLNLERIINTLRPKTVIADGSNYKSYVNRWKATCQKKKLPFHYTGEKGAYIFNLE